LLSIAQASSASSWKRRPDDRIANSANEAFQLLRPWSGSMKQVVAALIFQDDKILVCQRTRHQPMPLKWEFPGGKIEEGEQPRDALRRELEEELGIDAKIGDEVRRIRHEYKGGGSVELRFFAVREYQGELENRIFRDMRWAQPSELPSFDFLEADLGLVKDLAEGKVP
jgi:8-oxo-dGTP diphosphatase